MRLFVFRARGLNHFLPLSSALLIAGAHVATAQQAISLKEAYRNAFLIGSAVNEEIVSGADSVAQRILLRQFNTITAENVLKAGPINPEPGVYNFGPADAFVEFGERHGMFIVGHTLVWHNQTPDWFFQDETGKPNTRAAQIERLRRHIETVAGRYAGRIQAWDVVNEVIDNDGSYRPTTWVKGIGDGDELVKLAFRFAHQYAPDAELYYNDFNAWRPAKRDGIVRLVRMLQAEGIRIDGVGIQGHWGLNYPGTEYIEAAIDSFAALGVKVMITELDVDVLPLTREGQIIGTVMSHEQFQLEEFKRFLDPYVDRLPADVQQQLADRYAELFMIFHRKRDQLDRVTLWGVHDGMSWKNGYPVPGRTNYPLLYGRDRQPKPAFEAVLAAPRGASAHRAQTTYVIVHGAWGGGWDWRTVDSLLTRQGHQVYRPSLTGLGERVHLASPEIGLATHIDDVVNLIQWENLRDVVLIGHSYGGMVITGVADRIPERLRHLIYVDAMLPDSGESVASIRNFGGLLAGARDGFIPAGAPAERPVPKDVPQPLKTFTDTLHLSPARSAQVPGTYILTFEPGKEPDAFQHFADRAAARHWQVHRMEADHVPERSAPVELVELLLRSTP
jgi:endo-1,4-beta-xylanase